MIVKSIPRKSRGQTLSARIRTLTTYVRDCKGDMAKPGEKILYSGSRGFICDEFESQVEEMVALATAGCKGKNTSNSIKHYVMSWKEGEAPTKAQAKETIDILLRELRLSNCQVHWGLHSDTDNLHLHVIVNRVDPDTEKVLKPGGGFEKETLHRAIAKIEHVQGWRKEKNARYDIDASGKCVKREGSPDSSVEPSQRARDIEARTGEKSQERIGIENAAPIVASAKSWQEIHNRLEKINMRYERSGAGAIVWTGYAYVKASSVCKKSDSIDRLQKKLGVFEIRGKKNEFFSHEVEAKEQDADNSEFGAGNGMQRLSTCYLAAVGERQKSARVLSIDARPGRRTSGPVRRETSGDSRGFRDAASDSSERRGRHEPLKQVRAWDTYAQARREHYSHKNADRVVLNSQVSSQRMQLRTSQRLERDGISQGNWKGKGLELQAMSSVLSEKHAAQKAELQDKVTALRSTLIGKYKPFPDFEAWLKVREGDAAAYAWRYRESDQDDQELDQIGGQQYVAPKLAKDIQDFKSQVAGKWVHYLGADGQKAFSDTGRRIQLHTNDHTAILAALQLGAQKWGSVNIEGGLAFKTQAVELAAERGFKLKNQDIALEVAARIEIQRVNRQARGDAESAAQATTAAADAAARAAEEARAQAKARQAPVQKPAPVPAQPKPLTLAEVQKMLEAADALCRMKNREALELQEKLAPRRAQRAEIAAAKKNLSAMKVVIDKERAALDMLLKDAAALTWMQLIEKSKLDKSIGTAKTLLQSKIDAYNALVDVSKKKFTPASEASYQAQEAQYHVVYAEHQTAVKEFFVADKQYKAVRDVEAVEKVERARVQRNQVQQTPGMSNANSERSKSIYKPG